MKIKSQQVEEKKKYPLLAWVLRILAVIYFIGVICLFGTYLWGFIKTWVSDSFDNGDFYSALPMLLIGLAILMLPFAPAIWLLNWADDLDGSELWRGLWG